MTITVRAAVPGDAPRIAEIHVAGWRAAYRGQMPDAVLDGLSVEKRTEQWTQRIGGPRSPQERTWVAEDAGAIVAFANTGPSRDDDGAPGDFELFALYADPARWGTGAGRILTSHLLRDHQARGHARVALWVLGTNARARRFYGLAGFAADGARKSITLGGASLREVRYAFPSESGVRST